MNNKILIIVVSIIVVGSIIISCNPYVKIKYYLLSSQWDKAVNQIEASITMERNEKVKDKLLVYETYIRSGIIRASLVMALNSSNKDNIIDSKISNKYKRKVEENLKECLNNLEQVHYIPNSGIKFKILYGNSGASLFDGYKEFSSIRAADIYFNKIVCGFIPMDMDLQQVRERYFLNMVSVSGIFDRNSYQRLMDSLQAFKNYL